MSFADCTGKKAEQGENGGGALIKQKVEAYLESNRSEIKEEAFEISAEADLENSETLYWDNYCCKMINAGAAIDLMNSTFQQQIIAHSHFLGFEYVRFWDIYAPELYIDIHAERGKQNYSRLNTVTDFLVKNHLKPYIELGFKPIRILKTTGIAVKDVERDFLFHSEREMWEFYNGLM